MRKNLLGYIVLTMLLAVILTFSVSAASPKVSLSDATVSAGSTVSVDVTLENNPGLIVLKTSVKYNDSYFSVKSITDAQLLGTNNHSTNYTSSPYTLFWATPLSRTDFTANGKIATITFNVAENTPNGDYEFELVINDEDVVTTDLDEIGDTFSCYSGTITVKDGVEAPPADDNDEDDDDEYEGSENNTKAPKLSIDDVKVTAGKEFSLTLKITDNPGLVALRSYIDYNTKYFSVVGIKDHELIGTTSSLSESEATPYVVFCSDPLSKENITDDGKIITITFASKSTTPAGKYNFDLYSNKADIIDTDLKQLGKDFIYDGAVVTVTKTTSSTEDDDTEDKTDDKTDTEDKTEVEEYTVELKSNKAVITLFVSPISYGEGTLLNLDTDVLEEAVAAAKKKYPSKKIDVIGKTDKVSDDELILNFPEGYGSALESVDTFKFTAAEVTLKFNSTALDTIVTAKESVQIILRDGKLDEKLASKLTNGYEYFDLTMSEKLAAGSVAITLPYKNTSGVNGKHIVVYTTDGEKLVPIGTEASYSNGYLTFTDSAVRPYILTIEELGFEDIESHWAKNSINFVAARGIFNGRSETVFDPEGELSRGMLVTVLGRLEGIDVSGFNCMFEDVDKNQYYAPYIEWARRNSIVGGVGDNRFEPDRVVNRQEMAVIIARYLEHKGFELSDAEMDYSDYKEIDSWAKTFANKVGNAGIITGADGAFLPKNSANRAQAAAILERIVKYID